MSFTGMDTGAVDAVAGRLDSQAVRLEHVMGEIDRVIRSALHHWDGQDAQDFHHWWVQQHRPQLLAATASLHGAVTGLRNQVQEQLRASGGSGGEIGAGSLLALAGAAYDSPATVTHNGQTFDKVSDDELRALGIDPKTMTDDRTGFSATLYKAADGSYVLAFAGTDPSQFGDIATDAVGAKFATAQSQSALAIATRLDAKLGDDLSFTGHSLGGRLAAVASIATGNEATTFNAAGVSDAEFAMALAAGGKDPQAVSFIAKSIAMSSPIGMYVGMFSDGPDIYAAERAQLQEQVTAYHGSNDPLSNVQNATGAPDALGRQVLVDSGDKILIDAHNVDGLTQAIKD